MKDSQSGPCTEVSQQKAIDELEEIPVERKYEKKISTVPLQCMQGTEAFSDR